MCNVCGYSDEEISERGVPRLLHKLQVPKGTDFWKIVASEKFNVPISNVTKEQRLATKIAGMRILWTPIEELAVKYAQQISRDIGYWAPEIYEERLIDLISQAIQEAKNS